MELQSSSLFPILLCSVFFIFMATKIGKRSKSTSKLPPGPWKLPLIGNLHQMVGSLPHHALHDLAKKYGPLMYLQVGEVPTIVVSSAEYAKEVMKTHDIMFASRPKLNAAKILTYDFTSIAFSPYGEYWRKLRKISVLELLSMKRVQSLRPVREQEMSKLINWVFSNIDSPINLTEKIFLSTYNSVFRMLFKDKLENPYELVSLIDKMSALGAGFNVGDAFPSLKFLHLISGVSSELEKVHEKSSRILGNIIDRHITASKSTPNTKNLDDEDLVDVLLKFHEKDAELPLTIENIKSVIQDVIAGGADTSSITVDWAMLRMIKDPRVMKKAQAEVRRVFDGKGSVDESGIPELKYLKLVIKEVLRLHPPLPLLLPRENSERCEINGCEIPAKTRVVVNAWAIGRDPDYWVDAEKFNPERFLDSSIDFKGTDFEYIPFGAGRRMCPGMAFGIANTELMLSMLLYYFDWKLPEGVNADDLDMADSFGIVIRRRDDLHLIPTPYRSSPIPNP